MRQMVLSTSLYMLSRLADSCSLRWWRKLPAADAGNRLIKLITSCAICRHGSMHLSGAPSAVVQMQKSVADYAGSIGADINIQGAACMALEAESSHKPVAPQTSRRCAPIARARKVVPAHPSGRVW